MNTSKTHPDLHTNETYAAARYGGLPATSAAVRLNLPSQVCVGLEGSFQSQPGGGAHAMKPRFARHDIHVAAVLSEGGYLSLTERRR